MHPVSIVERHFPVTARTRAWAFHAVIWLLMTPLLMRIPARLAMPIVDLADRQIAAAISSITYRPIRRTWRQRLRALVARWNVATEQRRCRAWIIAQLLLISIARAAARREFRRTSGWLFRGAAACMKRVNKIALRRGVIRLSEHDRRRREESLPAILRPTLAARRVA
jgi:hypothetical protein